MSVCTAPTVDPARPGEALVRAGSILGVPGSGPDLASLGQRLQDPERNLPVVSAAAGLHASVSRG